MSKGPAHRDWGSTADKVGVPAPTDPITGKVKRTTIDQPEIAPSSAMDRLALETQSLINERARKCRACPAIIFFASSSKTNKSMPLETEPLEEGARFTVRKVGGRLYATWLAPTAEGWGFRTHFGNCPGSKQFRKT